jgi:tripartite-type tricarboxylate transporter receptor subunit TctC
MGDSVDNVPGVTGVGPKTASKLIAEHGDLEGVLAAAPTMKAGKLRGLAVTTAKRSVVLPELPTIAEAGVPDFAAPGWYALLGPAGTPPAVISTLHNEITRALKHPELLALFAGQALEPLGSTPQELGEFIRVELARWSKVIKDANIRVDPAGLPL